MLEVAVEVAANLAERVGAEIENVRVGIGSANGEKPIALYRRLTADFPQLFDGIEPGSFSPNADWNIEKWWIKK